MGAAEAIGFGGSVEYGVTAESAIEEVPDDNAGVGMVIGCVGWLLQATSSKVKAVAATHLYLSACLFSSGLITMRRV